MAKRKPSSVARGLRLLWGRQPPPSRGPKPSLSLADITSAAIELCDREGLAALSMRRVAERLGFTTMSLYRHVPGKDELLQVMLDAAIGDPPEPDRGATWRSQLGHWSRANLAVFHGHPWLLDIELHRAPFGPNQLQWLDAGLRALAQLELSEAERLRTVLLVDSYTRGFARISVGLAREQKRSGTQRGELDKLYASIFETVVKGGDYPALANVVAAGVFQGTETAEDDYEFGLERTLDGIEAYVKPRR